MTACKMDLYYCLLFIFITIWTVDGQCTFPAPYASNTWHDNTKGTLTFTETTMAGWGFTSYSNTVSDWQCVDTSSTSTTDTLVMRTTNTFSYSGINFYSYLCLSLTKITDYSYYYYQLQVQQANAGEERLYMSTDGALNTSDVCNTAVEVPTTEFHVLLLSGSEANATVQCPDSLLFSADYLYTGADGTVACDASPDVWDVCSDSTEMTFNYTTCSQTILGSTGGKFWCIATMTPNTTDFVVVFNQDATLASGASRFVCFATNGSTASLAPGNCTATQTASDLPTQADGTTTVGAVITIESKYATCVPTTAESGGGLSGGVIAAIVLVVLIVTGVILALLVYSCFIWGKSSRVRTMTPATRTDKERALLETGTDTASPDKRGMSRQASKLSKEKSTLSKERTTISTSTPKTSPRGMDKQGTDLSLKSVSSVRREGTETIITMKREKSTVSKKRFDAGTQTESTGFLNIDWRKLVFCTGLSKKQETEPDVEAGIVVDDAKKPLPAGPKTSNGTPAVSKSTKPEVTSAKGKKEPAKGSAKKKGAAPPKSPKGGKPAAIEDKPTLEKEKSTVSRVTNGKREGTMLTLTGSLTSLHSTEQGKGKEWTFLMCCYGNRKAQPPEEAKEEEEVKVKENGEVPEERSTSPKGKASAKGKAKGKPAAKVAPKGKTEKKEKAKPKKAGKGKTDKDEGDSKDESKKEKASKEKKDTDDGGRKEESKKEKASKGKKDKNDELKEDSKKEKASKGKKDKDVGETKEDSKKENTLKGKKNNDYDKSQEDDSKKESAGKGKAVKEKSTKEKSEKAGKTVKKSKDDNKEDEDEVIRSDAPVKTSLEKKSPATKKKPALERGKTLPLSSKIDREKTSSTLDAAKVKLEVHLPLDKEGVKPSAKVTKTKPKGKGSPKLKKAKTTLGHVSGSSDSSTSALFVPVARPISRKSKKYLPRPLSRKSTKNDDFTARPVSQKSVSTWPISSGGEFKIPPSVLTRS